VKTHTLTLILIGFLFSLSAFAEEKNSYVSDTDRSITIHRVGVLPSTDNKGGLYSRYVEDKLIEKVKKSHRFDQRELKDTDGHLSIDDYKENPEQIKAIGTANKVDALLAARVSKSNADLSVTLDLFLTSDGKLFAEEEAVLSESAGTSELENKTSEMYDKIIGKIPYKGLVLSREGNRVTIDLGLQDGIKENSIVSVAQIISLRRHPKFNFVVTSEKEILGKIRVVKADATLSFGLILQEKERGVIVVDSKITGLDFVTYPDSVAGSSTPEVVNDQVSFGKNPQAWVPKKKPGLGRVGLELGLGSLHNAITMQTAGSISSDISIYPQLNLTGELWLTPSWYLSGRLEQGITSISNPLGGSTPGNLAVTNSHYSVDGGYKFFLEDDYLGPQLGVHLGIGEYSFFVDASTPTAFTSLSYYGLYVGLSGSLPVTNDKTWYIDANINRYLSPGLTESPVTSGSTYDNSATEFSIGGSHKISDLFWLTAHLDFEFYGTNYTGQGTRLSNGSPDVGMNSSHSLFTLLAGLEFFF
jgi:hypothetical protein